MPTHLVKYNKKSKNPLYSIFQIQFSRHTKIIPPASRICLITRHPKVRYAVRIAPYY